MLCFIEIVIKYSLHSYNGVNDVKHSFLLNKGKYRYNMIVINTMNARNGRAEQQTIAKMYDTVGHGSESQISWTANYMQIKKTVIMP